MSAEEIARDTRIRIVNYLMDRLKEPIRRYEEDEVERIITAALAAKDAEPKIQGGRETQEKRIRSLANLLVCTSTESRFVALPYEQKLERFTQLITEIPLTREPTSQETGDDSERLFAFVTNGWFVESREADGNSTRYAIYDRSGWLLAENIGDWRAAIDAARSQSPDEPRPSGISVEAEPESPPSPAREKPVAASVEEKLRAALQQIHAEKPTVECSDPNCWPCKMWRIADAALATASAPPAAAQETSDT